MLAWLIAFIFTQIVECPIYIKAFLKTEPSLRKNIRKALGASALTHPVVWFFFPKLWYALDWPLGYWGMAFFAELFAVVVEALYLKLWNIRRAFLWSFVANAASLSLGLLSRHFFGVP